MATLRDKLWLWGQSPDCHWEIDNTYHLPGHSRMTAMEGAAYFGIPNMCRVRMLDRPAPPFDQESLVMRPCKRVVWSLLGAGGMAVTEWGDMEEVIRQAKLFPNVTGGVFDDFFANEARIATFTPEKLRAMGKKIDAAVGRHLDIWCVVYEFNLDAVPRIEEYLNAFDVITFWTWDSADLVRQEKNIARVRAMCPDKPILVGLYMWNYGGTKEMTAEQMQTQLVSDHRLLKEGAIDGIIVCSNCTADLGIPEVETVREWIAEHGEEEIG